MMKLSTIDIFRKVPIDLTQTTRRGGLLSIMVASVIGLVLFCETWTYFAGETKSHIVLDTNSESQIDINFELSFYELPCQYATIEMWDYLGNNKLDVSAHVKKRVIGGHHGEEHKHEYQDKGTAHTEKIAHDDHTKSQPAQLVQLTASNYGSYLKENQYTFVLYYVDWCMYCQMVRPVWEKFSKHLPSIRSNVKVAQVDCVAEAEICAATKIAGYPTFLMFKGVNPLQHDYHGHRSIEAFTQYVTTIADTPSEQHALKYQWHEGCFLRGHLTVNRVPGNFHVIAKSDAHSFNPKTTNTSHIVHHLSFGPELPDDIYMRIPEDVRINISPLDDLRFINHYGHMSHEHYIKVVSTRFEVGSMRYSQQVLGYQLSTATHQYKADPNVPEARFSYDLSPTAVVISQAGRRWYEFVTSLCAIIGGTFTTFSLMDGVLHSLQRRLVAPRTPSSKLT